MFRSFVYCLDERANVPEIGELKFDIAYGGAFYVFVQAADLGLDLTPANHNLLIDYGRKIKKAVSEKMEVGHPFESDLSFLYGTIFLGPPQDPSNHSRNVCIFADGELDRSATGSGVSARAALHFARNELEINQKITIESIIGTTMDVKITELSNYGPYQAVIPEVSGSSYFTGKNEFWFDPDDPLEKGFLLR